MWVSLNVATLFRFCLDSVDWYWNSIPLGEGGEGVGEFGEEIAGERALQRERERERETQILTREREKKSRDKQLKMIGSVNR